MKKVFIFMALILMLGLVVSCRDSEDELVFTVTFDTVGGTEIASQEVDNGGKVTRPEDPEKDGYVFSGDWLYGSFVWNFDVDIVTEDMTLLADWIEISSLPTNIRMTDDLFSSSVTWSQTDADPEIFAIFAKPVGGDSYAEVEGEIDISEGDVLDTVTFTPTTTPQGGFHLVQIRIGIEAVTSEELLFGGAGTEDNPYQVHKVRDVLALLDDAALQDQHFEQVQDVLMTISDPIEIGNDRKVTFNGTYDGKGFALSFSGNGALFHEIGEAGIVRNLVIDSNTQLSAAEENLYPIGTIADRNHGLIENIDSSAKLSNARLQGELPVFDGTVDTSDHTTGAGGIVGINEMTGTISHVNVGGAGAVKAGRGVGGVSAYNFGLIEGAHVTATLPAGNQANSGRSSNTYSYGGGITGFNFGTIRESLVSGRVFAQSAYSPMGEGDEGKNIAFGGIAGYNEGVITESSFARSMTRKEFIDKARAGELDDSANNLGVASVHGDLYVGGIAGINAGEISNTYVGGALIGARDHVGGVAGLTLSGGSIANTYVFAEVAIKDDGGVKLTEANDRTTLTLYEIAPDGFDAGSVFFKRLINPSTDEAWEPGDYETPMLPNFAADDYAKVGNKFAESGVLLWQQGSVTGVDITLETIVLPFGATETIEYVLSPANAPDTYTTWESSDESVVEILGEGLIRGVGAGTAIVTVTTRDGGHTDTIEVTVEDYVKVETVSVTADVLELPEENNIDDRPEVAIGTIMTLTIDLLPEEAEYKGYSISSSNSRAEVDGNTVIFVYGNTGPGNVSITVSFEDSSLEAQEYRFETIEVEQDVPIESVEVTGDVMELPEPNNIDDRPEVEIGTVLTFAIDILPEDASNPNYILSSSNSRAEVDGDTVTFVFGNTGPGNVSITVTFADTSVAPLEYRFLTVEGEEDVPVESVEVTGDVLTLPEANNIDDRPDVEIGTVLTLTIDILPEDASNPGYTITTSNSRAEADGNTITFVSGLSGPGKVSIVVTFDDSSVAPLEYRFTTQEVE